MASEIEIVNISNFEKIQNFLNDTAYKEVLENSENFNTRLCIERRLRMPFLDPQTGVAQTHCALFMKQTHRMPGFRVGQIYTYPAARWRKPKRQYLLHHNYSYKAYQFRENQASYSTNSSSSHPTASQHHHHGSQADSSAVIAATDGNSMSASGDNDSKDSHQNTEKEWFYEDMEMTHVDDFEEDFESDVDFEESYSSRKRKRPKLAKKAPVNTESTPRRGRKSGGGGGGRRKATGDCSINEKRRGGGSSSATPTSSVTTANNSNSASITSIVEKPNALAASNSNSLSPTCTTTSNATSNACGSGGNIVASIDDSSAQSMPSSITEKLSSNDSMDSAEPCSKRDLKLKIRADREVAQPSPYCDFCLGDARENKKTNLPEELVSCSDCGRSGHPTCLQFTPNMIISVKRYRWQCIECKYCSICGTSDNDDQLLFCDDCDRGYHMYCLLPPLITPPEGSWSCKLCLEEFHSGEN